MKKSELKEYIKNEIIEILSEATPEDIENQEKLNRELEKTKELMADLDEGETFTSEYQSIIGPMAASMAKLEAYVQKTGDGADQFIALDRAFSRFDEYMSYGDNLNEDEDSEPSDAELKKADSISKLASKLQQTSKEMKSVVKKWKEAEGEEKEKLTKRLKELTKIKKELEGLL
jgi:gas vesicle protein